jgi:hypothetical protein
VAQATGIPLRRLHAIETDSLIRQKSEIVTIEGALGIKTTGFETQGQQ